MSTKERTSEEELTLVDSIHENEIILYNDDVNTFEHVIKTLTVGVILDPGKAGQYGSKGVYFWGGAASTIFWIDPEEELVAVLMTQLLGSSELLRETYSALVYQAIDD